MPELPEVETIRAGLARTLVGARITDVEVFRDRSIRRQVGGAEQLAAALTDHRLDAAVRRGKFLWLPLVPTSDESAASNDPQLPTTALLVHLGMSGQLLVKSESAIADASPNLGAASSGKNHLRVRLHLRDANDERRYLDFVDQRTFGHLLVDELVATPDGQPAGAGSELAALPKSAAHIGRDLLDPAFDLPGTVAKLRRRQTGIKRALLDQQVASGIGNIYADEALWRAGVHFARATNRLRPIEIDRVLAAAADVMAESVTQGGTSFDELYVDVAGESGYFARSLAVYGRTGEPCPRCGTAVERASFMNRSSHYCPRCQPTPRGQNARW